MDSASVEPSSQEVTVLDMTPEQIELLTTEIQMAYNDLAHAERENPGATTEDVDTIINLGYPTLANLLGQDEPEELEAAIDRDPLVQQEARARRTAYSTRRTRLLRLNAALQIRRNQLTPAPADEDAGKVLEDEAETAAIA